MNFEVKEIDYCQLSVIADADLEAINNKRESVANEFSKVPVAGFRPGKASLEIIKIRFKKEIDEKLKIRLAEDAFKQLVSEQNIRPMGAPRMLSMQLNGGKFQCSFVFYKQPDFELAEYKNFTIPKPADLISVEELSEKIIQQIRVQNGESEPYKDDDFVQMLDSIIVDYEVSVDGVLDTEIKGVKEVLTVGQSPFPSFDENLLGMKNGEEREFEVTAPAAAPEKYRNKTLKFKVSLAMGAKQIPAPLDDKLAEKLSLTNMDELRQNVVGLATTRVQDYVQQNIAKQAAKRLQENHTFKIPDFLIKTESEFQAKMAQKDWDKISDEEKEVFITLAENSVKLTLVLERVREKEPESQLTDEEMVSVIKEHVAKMIRESGQNQDVDTVIQAMSKSGKLPILIGSVRDEYTLGFITKTCTIVE